MVRNHCARLTLHANDGSSFVSLRSLPDGKTGKGGWEYKMFTFSQLDGRFPSAQESTEEAAKLRQRLASALSL